MFRIYWPEAKLREILAEAEANGETRVVFRTISDAERFRFACYHHVRRKGMASRQLSFILNRSDCSILVKKVPELRVRIGGSANSGVAPQ